MKKCERMRNKDNSAYICIHNCLLYLFMQHTSMENIRVIFLQQGAPKRQAGKLNAFI